MKFNEFCKDILKFDLPNHCYEWVNLFEINNYQMILAPREHLKTVTIERYILYKICENPSIRIILVSSSGGIAEMIHRYIEMNLVQNKYIIDYYGYLPQGSHPCNLNTSVGKDANLYSVGVGGAVIGRRADIIVLEDVIENYNKDLKNKIENWIFNELLGCLGQGGKLLITGSRKYGKDMYENIMSDKPWIKYKVYKAIKEDGLPLWPEQWPLKDLEKRKEQCGKINFALNYMNEIIKEKISIKEKLRSSYHLLKEFLFDIKEIILE